MSNGYEEIKIGGGDTARPLAMAKRLRVIRRHLPSSGRAFLDCGCGCGEYVLAVAEQLDLDAHGIEFDEDKFRVARLKPALQGLVQQGDIQALPFAPETWDMVMLNEVLEHVPDDARALREVFRVLRPGGRLYVFSPNRWFPFETHGVKTKAGRPVPHWVPFIPWVPLALGRRWFDYWARNYWHGELARMIERAGFDVIDRTFVWLTFEDISGHQPELIRAARPVLRSLANLFERLPLVNRFGVSQVFVCRRPERA